MHREQTEAIFKDLSKKMVLLSGPRQVGKSWLARSIMIRFERPRYLNWDNNQDESVILNLGACRTWTSGRAQADFEQKNGEEAGPYCSYCPTDEPIPELLFRPLLEAWTYHMIVGGMPAAVRAWVQEQDMGSCRQRQEEIVLSYERDMAKHVEPRLVAKVWSVWNSIPAQLARENRKFVYRLIREGARAKDYEDAIRWIAQTGTIHLVHRIDKPGTPLSAYADPHDFKIYYVDVGLLCRKSELGVSAWLEQDAFFTEFKGALAENYVLQALVPGSPTIGYWTSEATAEVDFIIQDERRIIPVEVKSGQAVRSKSLALFLGKHGLPFGIRFSTRNVDLNSPIVNLPIFLAGSLKTILPGIIAAKSP